MRQYEKFQVSELDSYFEEAYARRPRLGKAVGSGAEVQRRGGALDRRSWPWSPVPGQFFRFLAQLRGG